MENASKALLIAGAILLVIAIIAIGMGILNKTKGTINEAGNQVDTMTVQMFNKQFEQYAGIGKTIEEAKELLSIVAMNNEKTSDKVIEIDLYNQMASDSPNEYSGRYWDKLRTANDSKTLYNWRFFTEGSEPTNGNIGKLYNIKMEYNSLGYIKKIYFYRWYN